MKYTAYEIDRMRKALRDLAIPWNRSYNLAEIERMVESRLLTYMANETTPDELEAEVVADHSRRHKMMFAKQGEPS